MGKTNICLILNSKSSEFIKNSQEYKIKSYNDFNFNKFKSNHNENLLRKNIIDKLPELVIKDIIIDQIDLKTGYICDIKSLQLVLNDSIKRVILKIENEDNELSNVARKINLYNNEVTFYEKISTIVNVNVPKFYCSLNISNKKSILLQNLCVDKGLFNINLNKNIDLLLSVVKYITEMHNRFLFKNNEEIIPIMKKIYKINDIEYYKELINIRFNKFLSINNFLLSNKEKNILTQIYNNYHLLINNAGKFPLNFCHGDLKSPNIFYKQTSDQIIPIFLDWQYIHLNKGISDIVFLLVESTDFDVDIIDILIKYYYKKSLMYSNINELMFDFKISLCIFPFFVMVWFNSENRDNLLDKVFPISFMKNTLKFYNHFLDDDFFNLLQ